MLSISARSSFLLAACVLAFVSAGARASGAPVRYAWPLTVWQPMAINFYAGGNNFVSVSCSVYLGNRLIAKGSAQAPYALSTKPGASANLGVNIASNGMAPVQGDLVICVAAIQGAKPTASGRSHKYLPAPKRSTATQVTMPNITIKK